MNEERDWDKEFWSMAEFEGPSSDDNASEIYDFWQAMSQEDKDTYTMLIKRREEMNYVQHQVLVNSFQSRTFFFAMFGFTLIMAMVLSVAWSIWYWVQ